MMSRELRQLLRSHGCVELRQKGSHLVVQFRKCRTVIPVHEGEDLKVGTLHAIEKQLAPCLGARWVRVK